MKFLIVEDDKDLNNILHDYIEDSFQNSVIHQCYDGMDAIDLFYANIYDLILLDVLLPRMNGFEIAKEIRSHTKTPIIMLSAFSDEENQIKGYNLGIDEFVKKPYSPKLVIKKMEAILSRFDQFGLSTEKQYGLIRYHENDHHIYIENEEIILNPKEIQLFDLFIHNKGIVLSRETILIKVWGYDYEGDERTVDTHIKRLRKKLKQAGYYIKTVYKTGYQFKKD